MSIALPEWLPEIIQWDGDWEKYVETIYDAYSRTYTEASPFYYRGMVVKSRKRPVANEKDGGFWHIIGGSNGEPEPRRCERVLWARAIIENSDDDRVLVWEEPSRHDGGVTDVVFWAKDLDYYVIIAKRNRYWVIRSAYCVVYESKRRQLERNYNLYSKR